MSSVICSLFKSINSNSCFLNCLLGLCKKFTNASALANCLTLLTATSSILEVKPASSTLTFISGIKFPPPPMVSSPLLALIVFKPLLNPLNGIPITGIAPAPSATAIPADKGSSTVKGKLGTGLVGFIPFKYSPTVFILGLAFSV